MKSTLLLLLLSASLPVFAERLVLFKQKPSPQSGLTPFTSYSTPYFDRLYYVGDDVPIDNRQVEKLLPMPKAQVELSEHNELLPYQWYLKNTGARFEDELSDIRYSVYHGVEGIDLGLPDSSEMPAIPVAVIDSGVDVDHPALRQHLYLNGLECDSTGRPRLGQKDDLDGNGFVGDCHGWDFSTKNGSSRVVDDTGHGTHVAGLIGAQDPEGIRGAYPGTKILPLKVFSKADQSGRNLTAYADRFARAILYAVSRKVKIINLSLGWPRALHTEYLEKALDEALKSGVLIVAAAGNNNSHSPVYPCTVKGVICVGSHRPDGKVSDFSNFGGHVDFLAPGEQILSTVPTYRPSVHFKQNGYDYKNGTSQASPLVAALLAWYISEEPQARSEDLLNRLHSNADFSDTEAFLSGRLRYGKRNLTVTLPVLKDLHLIKVKKGTTRFSFLLPFKNYSAQRTRNQITINLGGGKRSLGPWRKELELKPYGEDHILIEGELPDEETESELTLKVELRNQGYSRKLQHLVEFSYDFEAMEPVFRLEDVRLEGLTTLATETPQGQIMASTERNADALHLRLFAVEANGSKSLGALSIPGGERIINSAFAGDVLLLNALTKEDGKPGLRLYRLRLTTDALSVIDALPYVPTGGVLENGNFHFDQERGKIYFIGQGKRPSTSPATLPWEESDEGVRIRLYELKVVAGEWKTYHVDDLAFWRRTRQELKLPANTSVGLFPELKSTGKEGFRTYFVTGQGFFARFYELRFRTSGGHEIRELGGYHPALEAPAPACFGVDLCRLSFGNQWQSYSIHVSSGRFVQGNFSIPQTKETFIGTVGLWEIDGVRTVLFQTKTELALKTTLHDREERRRVKRFSFLPGDGVSTFFLPGTWSSGDSLVPAVVVDSRAFSGENIKLYLVEDGKITSPLKHSYHVPRSCRMMNFWKGDRDRTVVPLACQEGKDVVFRFIQ